MRRDQQWSTVDIKVRLFQFDRLHFYFTCISRKPSGYSAIFHHLRMSYLDSREVDDYDMDDDATVTIAGTT